jgi:hypothetical protein
VLSLPWKKYRITGHLFFLILLVLAGIFYKERILYADSAFYIFKIINFSKFNVEAGRVGALLTQVLPLSAVKLGLPLKSVILSYSLSFPLIYFLVYLISVYLIRNDAGGLVIILVLVLGIRHSFYHTVTETHQGLVYAVLLFAWLDFPINLQKGPVRELIHISVSILIIMLCYFVHPVTIFPVLFIIGYRIIDKNDWRNYRLYALIIFTLLLYSLKFLTTEEQSYEGQIFESFSNITERMGEFFNLYSLKFFMKRLGGMYLFTGIIALIMAAFYIHRKKYLRLAYYIISIAGFFVITVLTYHSGDSDMAMERAYMPLGIIICIPFIKEVIFGIERYEFLKYVFLVSILAISVAGIYRTGSVYSNRLAYVDELFKYTRQYSGRKFIMEKQDVDMTKLYVPWAIGAETLLYSSLDSPGDARTIYLVETLVHFDYREEDTDLYLCVDFWRDWNAESLNKSYFELEQGKYVPLDVQ